MTPTQAETALLKFSTDIFELSTNENENTFRENIRYMAILLMQSIIDTDMSIFKISHDEAFEQLMTDIKNGFPKNNH